MATSLQTHHANESAQCAATHQAHGIESTGLQPCDTHFVPFLSEESDTYVYRSESLDDALAGRGESTETNGETVYPVMIDSVAFDRKPTNPETGGITNRLKKTMYQLVTAEQLRDAIIHGHTCCYGCFEQCADGQKFGHSKFIGQRLMAVDIDNAHEDKTPIEFWEYGFLDVPRAIDRCLHGLGQLPLIVYESFRSTESHPKFRLVIDFGEVVTDYGEALALIGDVLALFPEHDAKGKCEKPDALFFGTTPANGQYWSADRLKGWS